MNKYKEWFEEKYPDYKYAGCNCFAKRVYVMGIKLDGDGICVEYKED